MINKVLLGNKKSEDDWKKDIDASDVFLVVGTNNYFKSCRCFDQCSYALSKGKTFLIAMQEGVKIPEGYPIPKNSKTFTWKTEEELLFRTKKFADEL